MFTKSSVKSFSFTSFNSLDKNHFSSSKCGLIPAGSGDQIGFVELQKCVGTFCKSLVFFYFCNTICYVSFVILISLLYISGSASSLAQFTLCKHKFST